MAGPIKRFWKWFWRPTSKFTWGAIFIVGGIAGIVFWGGFNTFMEYTNTLQFCISCHEMEDNVYLEYRETIHYKNRTGVRVICADCHVPKEWTPKLIRKIKASNELYHKALGTIDTREKFIKERWRMANNVWKSMKATDSRECRNCHSFTTMELEEQDKSARKKHIQAQEEGKTCIDCHQGIAHELPDEPEDMAEAEE